MELHTPTMVPGNVDWKLARVFPAEGIDGEERCENRIDTQNAKTNATLLEQMTWFVATASLLRSQIENKIRGLRANNLLS